MGRANSRCARADLQEPLPQGGTHGRPRSLQIMGESRGSSPLLGGDKHRGMEQETPSRSHRPNAQDAGNEKWGFPSETHGLRARLKGQKYLLLHRQTIMLVPWFAPNFCRSELVRFSSVLLSARSLQTLQLPRSEITDLVVEQIARRLPMVTFLDLSYCNMIGAQALAIIGKNCKMLSSLCRSMTLINPSRESSPEDEVHAIASTMPKLKHLEIAYQLINTESLLEILSSCPDLEFLYLRGCYNVGLGHQFFKERHPKLTVLGLNNCHWDDFPDLSKIPNHLLWVLEAGDIWDSLDGLDLQ